MNMAPVADITRNSPPDVIGTVLSEQIPIWPPKW